MDLLIHLIVQGQVQGIWFRHNVKEYAQQKNINGTIQNLKNNQQVEIFAQAPKEKITQLISWLKENPGISQIEDVQILKQEPTKQNHYYSFRIL